MVLNQGKKKREKRKYRKEITAAEEGIYLLFIFSAYRDGHDLRLTSLSQNIPYSLLTVCAADATMMVLCIYPDISLGLAWGHWGTMTILSVQVPASSTFSVTALHR